jgi:DNA-binding transcriptional LysR family regulator
MRAIDAGTLCALTESQQRCYTLLRCYPKAISRRATLSTRDFTLHQLKIFWAVAQSKTLTKAAKQLGLTQPSLSQQLAKLETNTGTLLFERRASEMALTEAGSYLLPKVEHLLRTLGELEDGLQQFQDGKRMTIGIAGVNSVLRVLVPPVMTEMQSLGASFEFDILEAAPNEVLEYLYARRVKIGLLAANSVAESGVGFAQVPLLDDPYVLAVPRGLKLENTKSAEDLSADELAQLNRAIQFSFGTQHTNQSIDWYNRVLPDHHITARCRSFETAMSLVSAGNGVCLTPLMVADGLDHSGVTFYRFPNTNRRIVVFIPTQYARAEPYVSLLAALENAAKAYVAPQTVDAPEWLVARALG